jgi:DNA repair exonuclease SbcCD nuclease subunit
LHLDAPFKGVDAADARVRETLAASTYRALDSLVAACIETDVDFLVISGDVYNQAEKSLRAQFAFKDACERLAEAGVRVYVARGNHDPASGWSAALTLPETVHVFSESNVERVVFERDGEVLCVLYGRSFRVASESANLAVGFEREPSDPLAIGVLHANVGGRTDYDDYAPCTLDDLRSAGMDYWALGHIHKPEVLSESPRIAYAGCTQGLDPSEPGARGCWLVTLDASGASAEFMPTAEVVWTSADLDISDIETLEELEGALSDACAAARSVSDGRPTVCRIELMGRSAVHGSLARPGVLADLVARVRDDALAAEPWVWVDRVRDRTRPALDLETIRAGSDFASDLVRLADELAADPEAAASALDAVVDPLASGVDSRDLPDIDAPVLIARARDAVLDRLLAEEGR